MKVEIFSVMTNGAQYSEHAMRVLPPGNGWKAGPLPEGSEVVKSDHVDISGGIIVGAWGYTFWREVSD
jgi:hypothetical protein